MKSLILLTIFTITGSCFAAVDKNLKGTVKIDGSSTVFPITEAVAEEFQASFPSVRVAVGVSGTGGGFKKFTVGETDINNASRHIKGKEITKAKSSKIEYLELPVAYDGITVVVSKQNKWLNSLTTDELQKLWSSTGNVKSWSDLRPTFPKTPVKLYGPAPGNGTFDYFTEAILGEKLTSRDDYEKNEKDNVMVVGVSKNPNALAYFGFAYYQQNKDKLKAVKVDGGKGAIEPTMDNINDGTYSPLSRPVYIYISKKSAQRSEVRKFVEFYIENAAKLSEEVGYIPMPKKLYEKAMTDFKAFAEQKVASN